MTQEEKAQAYDEALNKAKIEINTKGIGETVNLCEQLFPQLAESDDEESDDERIRKRLIEYFEGFRMGNAEVRWEGLIVQEVLAWLKKQKETSHISEMCKENADSFTEDERIRQWLYDLVDEGAYLCERPFATESILAYLERQKEQKQAQTSEEKEYIRTIKSIISDFIRDKKPENLAYYQRIYDWLDGRHVPFSCGHENGEQAEWAEPRTEFNITEAFKNGKKEVIDHPDKYGLTKKKPMDFPTTDEEVKEFLETHPKVEVPEKYKTPDFVFSKQEYESYPIISEDTTSTKPVEFDGKTLLYTADKSYQIGFRDGVASVKPEWSEDIIRKAVKEVGLTQHQINWFETNVFPPKQEWSEEDEGELQNAIDALEFLGKKGVYKSESGYDAALQAAFWLKSLPERLNFQPKEECGEDDEAILSWCISDIERAKHCASQTKPELCDIEIHWLKSLKPRWKPSEEQMKAFEDAMSYIPEFYKPKSNLASLLRDLKKL